MVTHSEHLRKADESYEFHQSSEGHVVHVYVKDGEALIFPTLDALVKRVYFGQQTEFFGCGTEWLDAMYHKGGDYYTMKMVCG